MEGGRLRERDRPRGTSVTREANAVNACAPSYDTGMHPGERIRLTAITSGGG
jgi:hypothetical protein